MFKLVNYVKKELKQIQLNEAFKSLGALSDEVKNKITGKWNKHPELGENSKVELVKYDPSLVYNDMVIDRTIVHAVLRYGQDDLVLFTRRDSYGGDIYTITLSELYIMNDGDFNFSTIKSESGFKKNCNNVVKFIIEKTNLKRKDVLNKFNFQLVYSDLDKQQKHNDRRNMTNDNKLTIDRNNVSAISNYAMQNVDIQRRLKNYIENKIPNITDIKDLPRTISMFKENFQFKIFGNVYRFYAIKGNISTILLNNQDDKVYIVCFSTGSINTELSVRPPSYILFMMGAEKLPDDTYKFMITDIYGSHYAFFDRDASPIDNWFK